MVKYTKLKSKTKNSLNKTKKDKITKIQKITEPKILHREKQREKILNWVKGNKESEESSFLYIFGPPGTGKTVLIQSLITQNFEHKNSQFTSLYTNCMSITTWKELSKKIQNFTEIKNLKNNEKLNNKISKLILILDEIHQSMIPSIMEHICNQPSSLLIIGISNCLSPHSLLSAENTLAFPPYTSNELLDIIKNNFKDFDDTTTLEYISKKIASTCGDLRKAFSLSKNVYESTLHLKDSPGKRRAKMMSMVCPSNQSAFVVDDSMPFQQKIIACALIVIKENQNTLVKLYDEYGKICREKMLPKIDFGTFCSSCELMAASGLVKLNSAKGSSCKISFGVDVGEIERVLNENELFRSILNRGG